MIRKVYSDLIRRKLLEDGPGWLTRRAGQYLLLQLSRLLHRPLCGPALGTLMVTYRCTFHCAMCDMPLKAAASLQRGDREFDTDRFRNIIGEFADLGVPGIGFTGGEPFLRGDLFELLAETRQRGMIAHLNTNGWLLGEREAERIIDIAVDSVNISLDGAVAETHDRIRKAPGSFERAIRAVRMLTNLREQRRSSVRIKTVAVLDETNMEEVPRLLELGSSLGVDCIELIPRQPFLGSAPTAEAAPQELLEASDRLAALLLDNRDGDRLPLENSPAHLRLFRRSFAGERSPVRCSAGYNSLAVDCYGNLFPCVPWINWGKTAGNIGAGGLADAWRSASYQRQREIASRCRDCYLNCQTELNLLFDIPGRLFPTAGG